MRVNTIKSGYNGTKNINNLRANQTNSIQTKSVMPKLSNAQNMNFGIDPIAGLLIMDFFCILGATLIEGSSEIKTYIHDKKAKQRQAEQRRMEEAREKKIEELQTSLNVSKEKATQYHDKFLDIAYIKPSNDGHEKGINAIMGYGVEKYDLAMRFLAPVISMQKELNKQEKKAAENVKRVIPDGLLLYGPGGSGKTYIAEHLAEHLKEFDIIVTEIDFDDVDHKKNARAIRDAFQYAKMNYINRGRYTVIRFKDDIEDYLTDRSEDNEYIYEMRMMLKYSDRCASNGAIWLATANNPKNLDPSILRRATIKMPIGNMKDFQIGDMLKYETIALEGRDVANKVDYDKVVEHIKESGKDFTPDEYRIFVMEAKNVGEVTADSLITAIDTYIDTDMMVLDDERKQKFAADQKFIEEFNENNEEQVDNSDKE